MIAVDTNILVYAHRIESPFFGVARKLVEKLAQAADPWTIPWPCLHEFYAVVTNPKIFDKPTPPVVTIDQITAWLESPSLALLAETDRHWPILHEMLLAAPLRGIKIHDAKIAAICLQHGVSELWTADRDFSRFPKLKIVNPLRD